MHGAVVHRPPKTRPPKPLVVRAGLSRTFCGLAAIAALSLLALGIYLLADALTHPLDAEAAGLLVAAFAIALAILLLFFVLKPRKISGTLQHQVLEDFATGRDERASPAPSVPARRAKLRMDLPYQRAYVDRSRIRP